MSIDFNKTINLPHTKFSMRANLIENEPVQLKRWNDAHYQGIQKFFDGREEFTIHDGPPYANGAIHMGHAINKLLKDFIIRSKTMDHFKVNLIPGWDCHGLPIEIYVEKHIKSQSDIAHQDWQGLCRNHAEEQSELQKRDFQRLGIFANWSHPYKTMDFKFEADIVRILGKVWELGYLKRDLKPVHWCTICSSALAESEVIYAKRAYTSLYFGFKVLNLENCAGVVTGEGVSRVDLAVWTTTPWTISENAALAINTNIRYIYVESPLLQKGLIISENCFHTFKSEPATDILHDYSFVTQIEHASDLLSLEAQHPFLDRIVTVLQADFVSDRDHTTGIVHIAPAHGVDDFCLARKNGIDFKSHVGKDGHYSSSHPLWRHENIFTISDQVVQILKEHHSLIFSSEEEHVYPFCWRHNHPLIFLATMQWFLNLQYKNLSSEIRNNMTSLTSIPTWGSNLLSTMIGSREEWCISRQRKWGVPIPLFTHKITNDVHPDTPAIIERVAMMIYNHGAESFLNDRLFIETISDHEYYQCDYDILDVWFDSGCVPLILQGLNSSEADLVVEGVDQCRGWFQSTIILSHLCQKKHPYKALISHGFVVDKHNKKMSKSVGNIIAPQDLVNKYGADVVRLYTASLDYLGDMVVSEELLNVAADKYRKIRNTVRFLLAAIEELDLNNLALVDLIKIDTYILERTARVQEQIISFFRTYEFHRVVQAIFNFCLKDLSSFYINIIKDRQYTSPKHSNAFISIQVTCYHLVNALLSWIAPILPFTAQEILDYKHGLGHIGPTDILHLTWYDVLPRMSEVDEASLWDTLYTLYHKLFYVFESKKTCHQISAHAKIADCQVTLQVTSPICALLIRMSGELRYLFQCAEVIITHTTNTDNDIRVEEITSPLYKCPRCWNKFRFLDHVEVCLQCEDDLSLLSRIKRLYV